MQKFCPGSCYNADYIYSSASEYTIECAAVSGCQYAQLRSYAYRINCEAEFSCYSTTIIETNYIYGRGSYSLANAIINSTNHVEELIKKKHIFVHFVIL